jgi:hypothetical protein
MRQAAGSVGGSIRRLAVTWARQWLLAGRAVYHQCWSRIAFLQVISKTAVSGTRGSREASAMADSSAPLAGNLKLEPERVYQNTRTGQIALLVRIERTARRVCDYSG